MKDIESIRNEINSIDEELVKLFKRRLEIVEEVAASKRESASRRCVCPDSPATRSRWDRNFPS